MAHTEYRTPDSVTTRPDIEDMKIVCDLIRAGIHIDDVTPIVQLWADQFGAFDKDGKRIPVEVPPAEDGG